MNLGQHLDEYFVENTLAGFEVANMGEHISDCRFKDMRAQDFTTNFKDIKLMMYRDPTFNTHEMQSTVSLMFLDDLLTRRRRQGDDRWAWRCHDGGDLGLPQLWQTWALGAKLLQGQGRQHQEII